MISYASIDRIVSDNVVIELEKNTLAESRVLTPQEKITVMVVVKKEMFNKDNETYEEGDIILVSHEAGFITEVLGKDEEEKQRRITLRKNKKIILIK